MNHQKFNVLLFTVVFLLNANPMARAQEVSTTVLTASTDAADRQFLNKLEQAEGTKPAAIPAIPARSTAPVTAQPLKAESPAKPATVVKKAHAVVKGADQDAPARVTEIPVMRAIPVTTVTKITTTTEAPEEDRRGDENGFFHRLFHHHSAAESQ